MVPNPKFDQTAHATAARRLADALAVAVPRYGSGHQAVIRELDSAACALVDQGRAAGLDVVKILLEIKEQLAAQSNLSPIVHDELVRRCIARFYEGQPASDSPALGTASTNVDP